MSCRRSTRLAHKNLSSSGKSSDDVPLGCVQTEPQNNNLKARTPRSCPRIGLSRCRNRSGGTTPSIPPNQRVNPGLNVGASPSVASPRVLTQDRFKPPKTEVKGAESINDNGFDSKLDDSLLFALDQVEEHHQKAKCDLVYTIPILKQPSKEVHSHSQDLLFDDDEEDAFLEAMPLTPPNEIPSNTTTPKASRKRSRNSKKLDLIPSTGKANNVFSEPLEYAQGFPSAIEIEPVREPSPKKSKRRSNGEKKITKKAAQTAKNKNKKKGKFKLAFTNRKATRELANSASNELSKNDLSLMSTEEKLQLSSWSLPQSILDNYKRKGITSLFPWQLECLANEKVLEGKNLLYSAPTSAGKTLVSEILMIKRVLELGRKAIMILPFVSVAREKVYNLQSIFGDAGIRVEGFMGSVNPPGGFKAVDIAVCTIEKANSLVNKLLEEECLTDLGTLVVDELHLIGDSHRGYLLELLLTKILYMTSVKDQGAENSMNISNNTSWRPRRYHIQVIGMSATLPNLDLLAKWINAELYVTDFRPVPLKEVLKIGDTMLDQELVPVRDVKNENIPIQIPGDTDDIIYLTLETILEGFSVLIFCPTKANVESTAEKLALQFYNIGATANTACPEISEKLRSRLDAVRIKALLQQLMQCPGGADLALSKTIMFGIGFHHAGLTYENRDIVESGFKKGILKVIVATSTLSAGVNLPARRVIITTPLFNRSILDTMTYRQMCGRAGRNGIDTEGESILVCPTNLKDKGMQLFKGSMPLVRSALLGNESLTSAMKRALLEVIASKIATLIADVTSYSKCTFLFHSLENGLYDSEELTASQNNKDTTVEDCLKYLEEKDLIRIQHFEQEDRPDEYMPTQLGSACLAASLAPDDGIIVYKELLKARECFVLENELHVIYQVTPIYVSDHLRYIDWGEYSVIYDKLDLSEKKVAELVGIKDSFIIRAMIGAVSWNNPSQRSDMAIHQRFYAALALSDLVNEKKLEDVALKFQLNKGVLQNLQQAASTFAGMITAFCGRLGWANLELLLSQFRERLEFGVQRELCDLVRLDSLNGQRARILYDAGIKTVMELAAAEPAQVEQILHKAAPFKSNVHGGRESSVWMIGKDHLSEAEASQKIVDQARIFIQIELGQKGNIQFAFANNNNPVASEKQERSLNVSRRRSSKSEQEGEEAVSDEKHTDKYDVDDSRGGDVEAPNDPKTKTDEFKREGESLLNELFSQRPVELEASLRNSVIVQDTEKTCNASEAEVDMFEDSFPEIVSTNLSALYPKSEKQPETPKAYTFSIQQHIEKIESRNSDRQQQHSTPLLTKGKSQRFTLKPEDNTSPVRPVNYDQAFDEDDVDRQNKEEDANLTEGLLAELDHDFESFNGVQAKESFNLSKASRSKAPDPNVAEGTNVSVKFNESDVAAIRAIADCSTFESEELFPVVETNRNPNEEDGEREEKRNSPPQAPSILPSVNENLLDGLSEEDFILTQGPFVGDSEENDLDTFEESSSETNYSGDTKTTEESCSTLNEWSPEEPVVIQLEVSVGGQKLMAKITSSVEQIPKDYFKNQAMIGVGMKLPTPKKSNSSAVLSRQGIGAKILAKGKTTKSEQEDDPPQQSSVAFFNGSDTIWVFRSVYESKICVASRKKPDVMTVFHQSKINDCALVMFKSKEKIKSLLKLYGGKALNKLPPSDKIWDPKIAQWMLEFDEDEGYISDEKLIEEYLTPAEQNINKVGLDKEIFYAFCSWKVMDCLKRRLEDKGLWKHFTDTEMTSVLPYMLMESNGFRLDAAHLTKLRHILQFKSAVLELRAFLLAGRQFSLGSPKDIKQILFREIGLKQPKAKGTSKDVLLKLDHELPGIIVEWRKINNALNKFVIPFQQERNLQSGRVHGNYSHFTATGRLTMQEPNLQCIPRDFDISQLTFTRKEILEIKQTCKIKFGTKLTTLFQVIDNSDTFLNTSTLNNISQISMRNSFVPCNDKFVILTADYSQLELRILAHLSGDIKLLNALNADADVFVEIAAQWKKLPKNKITYSIRQEAKAIVYGVIYGMGAKTLSEQMEIDEREAYRFMDQFMRTYTGVSTFLTETKKICREKGYVETMTGRRRYLPLINSLKPHERAKGERQAVNTQIQGSAADLVKTAMCRIHSVLSNKYPESALPIDFTTVAETSRRISLDFGLQDIDPDAEGGLENIIYMPILNLHDELIFEVRQTHLQEVAEIIGHEMESCVKLKVKLPVVVKVGESWGSLENYDRSKK